MSPPLPGGGCPKLGPEGASCTHQVERLLLGARPREAFWSTSCETWHVSTLVLALPWGNSHSCGANVLLRPGKT